MGFCENCGKGGYGHTERMTICRMCYAKFLHLMAERDAAVEELHRMRMVDYRELKAR